MSISLTKSIFDNMISSATINFDNDCLKIAIDNELKFFVVIENDDNLKLFVENDNDLKFFVAKSIFLIFEQSFFMC